jgi:hypothetical protein
VDEIDDDCEIGYGKPPKDKRFAKGRSGNPNGRPKGSKNLLTSFLEISRERITVKEGGRPRTMTKGEAVLHQLTNKAASGDLRAIREFFQIHSRSEATETVEEMVPDLRDGDKELMSNFMKRMARMNTSSSPEIGTPT